MAIGQYQHRQFFRRVPNKYLAEYFEQKGVDLGVDFKKLKESEVEPIFKAFITLDEDEQASIEMDFQDINALASDSGIDALRNEALFYQDTDFPEELAKIDGDHGKAIWAFLHKREYWEGASALLHADTVSSRFWKKRNNLPNVPPQLEDADLRELEKGISNYFYGTEGRGRHCKVEAYRKVDAGKEYLFAYPEDYRRSMPEWVHNSLTTRTRQPAFEIIFVYCEAEGSLDIYAPKNAKAVPKLQEIFAKAILKLDTLPDGRIDNRVYELDPLAVPGFDFKIPANAGISDVLVTKLRITLKQGSRRRILVEADTQKNANAVYDLLKELNPPPYFVTQAHIRVLFDAQLGKRAGSRTFTIGYPNSCNLKHDGRDAVIRQMLINARLEPQPPKEDEDT